MDTSSANKLMFLDCGITCYMPVDVIAGVCGKAAPRHAGQAHSHHG